MTFLGAIILFQNILAAATDSVAARTVKFTITSFVPVIGSALGDATTTLMGSMQAVKSVTGVFGVLVIIITLLPPLISVILHKLLLKITEAFALILSLDKQAGFLKEMNVLLDMTLGVMVAVSVVFIFDITLFIKTMAVV
jgi:stage III sporulation protein AE